MLKFLTGAAFAGMVMAGTAVAADVAMPAPAFDWTGGYFGLEAGAEFNNSTWIDPAGVNVTFNTNGTGLAVGGVLGYRWQKSSNLILGAELSGDWLGTDGEANCVNTLPTCITKSDFIGLGTVNVGVAAGMAHFYVDGGVAAGDYSYSQKTALVQSWNGGLRLGWTAGAGVELALTSNLVAGLRWNY